MNLKVIDTIFIIIILSLPFKYLPKVFWQTLLGGTFGQDLIIYPLTIGIIYTGYCQYKYKNIFYKWNIFSRYASVYLLILFVSLIWGILNFPYYSDILSGPITQIEKIPHVLTVLKKAGISIDPTILLQIWMLVRPIKNVICNTILTFGGAYMIFCWYHNRLDRGIVLLKRGVLISLVCIAIYGLVDVWYQNGQMWAQDFLAIFNPLLHSINEGDDWTLRLYWGGQNRSLFLEPSYFGIYMSFAFPILWWMIIESHGIKKFALNFLCVVLLFEIFLTQSRTAMALSFGEILVVISFIVYRQERKLLLNYAMILGEVFVAFIAAMYFMGHNQVPVKYIGEPALLATRKYQMDGNFVAKDSKQIAEMFANENAISLVDSSKADGHAESNHTRYTIIKTNIAIGKEHPILGIGTSLRTAYLYDKLKNNSGREIQQFNQWMEKRGLLRQGYPDLGDYAGRFAETGILGLLIFMTPLIVIIYQLGTVLLNRRYETSRVLSFLFICTSLIGISISGLGDSINITYCYWLMLGMSYILYYEKKRNEST